MPTTIFLTKEYANSGINVTWTKTTQRISIGGWYDGCIGIEGESLTLHKFFDRLGITEKDVKKAFNK
jgi:hypothetical protein